MLGATLVALVLLAMPAGSHAQGGISVTPGGAAFDIDWVGPTPFPLNGACCLPNGQCQNTSLRRCVAQGGDWQGWLSNCAQQPCPPLGACCLPDNTCRRMTREACEFECGYWRGPNTACRRSPSPTDDASGKADYFDATATPAGGDPADVVPVHPCPIFDYRRGACCLPDGTCEELYQCNCENRGGRWAGILTSCDDRGVCAGHCCDPADEPGQNGNPFCFEGHTCCNGTWVCNGPTAEPACPNPDPTCPACCDRDDIPPCIEGATCCGDGTWACNEGDGSPTCDVIGHACEQCCDPADEPGMHGNPICFEGHTCCADGVWRCNDADTSNTCENGDTGNPCRLCCDPNEEPGVGDNPICFEGHTCCATGEWVCNGPSGTTDCRQGEVCGGVGKCCTELGDCVDGVSEVWCEQVLCGRWSAGAVCGGPNSLPLDCPIPPIFVQACCLPDGSCIDTTECDCRRQGGMWHFAAAIPGGLCEHVTCPGQVCGGIAGIECPEGQYCALNDGECCCDFQGVCRPIPDACPEYYDPVCGCDGQTYDNRCFAAAAGVSIDHPGPCCQQSCGGPLDVVCPDGTYCHTRPGHCDQIGCCEPQPIGCPDVWDPVCGCDGQTYSNECDAAAAGTSVRYRGVCQEECTTNEECVEASGSDNRYCHKAPGDCDGEGTCADRPFVCPLVYDPVCGCDGNTYSNACFAAAAGMNIAYDGECDPVGRCCLIPHGCVVTTEEDCRVTQCGFWSGPGTTCEPSSPGGVFPVCPIIDPIFGACCLDDGSCVMTYECDCNRQGGSWRGNFTDCSAAGICPGNGQICGGFIGVPCPQGQFCDLPIGHCCCDFQGVCRDIPEACYLVYDPVCGCDGVTYGNACQAAMAQMSIDYEGECSGDD